mgnify:CR=1 FL=1
MVSVIVRQLLVPAQPIMVPVAELIMLFALVRTMMVIIVVAFILITKYKQIRFAQYLLVILPVFLELVLYSFIPHFRKEQPPYFLGMMVGIALFMGVLNFLVSKKLGEL